MGNQKYTVRYKSYTIRANDYVRRNGFSCITFENVGDTDVLIDNEILIPAGSGDVHQYNELPKIVIAHEFEIKFIGNNGENALLVKESYYKEV